MALCRDCKYFLSHELPPGGSCDAVTPLDYTCGYFISRIEADKRQQLMDMLEELTSSFTADEKTRAGLCERIAELIFPREGGDAVTVDPV